MLNRVNDIVKNTLYLIFGNFARVFLLFAVSVLLARYLGSEEYGVWCTAIAFVSIFSIGVTFGVNNVLVRDISVDPEKSERLLNNGVTLSLFFSLIIYLIIVISLLIIKFDSRLNICIVIMSIQVFLLPVNLITVLFQVKLIQKHLVVIDFLTALGFITASLVLMHLKADVFQFVILMLVYLFIQKYLYIRLVRKLFNKIPRLSFHVDCWRYLLKESWPILLTQIFVIIILRIDCVFLARIKGTADVGIYSACTKLIEALSVFPAAYVASVLPIMSDSYENDKPLFNKIYDRSFKYWLIFIIPLCVLAFFYAKEIIFLFYGNAFISAVPCFQALIWSEIFIYTGTIHFNIILAIRKQYLDFYLTGLSALTNILLNFMLIPKFGIIGAAITSGISYAITIPLELFIPSIRIYGITILRNMLYPATASICMGLFLCYFRKGNNVFIIAFASLLVYVAVLFLLRAFDIREIAFITALSMKKKN